MIRTVSRPRRIALVASLVVATSVVAGCTAVIVSTRSATAESATVVTAANEHRIETERSTEVRQAPDQVVRGALGAGARADAITFVYAGDSITARPGSWLHVLQADTRFHAIGGYAHSGYRSDQVLAELGTVPTADVAVIELGTNDINQDIAPARTLAEISAVATKAGAEHVLLIAAPPSDRTDSLWGVDRRTGSAAMNARFEALAARRGWTFADPFAADRRADNGWVTGTSRDGIHPTTDANRSIAVAFGDAIARAADPTG